MCSPNSRATELLGARRTSLLEALTLGHCAPQKPGEGSPSPLRSHEDWAGSKAAVDPESHSARGRGPGSCLWDGLTEPGLSAARLGPAGPPGSCPGLAGQCKVSASRTPRRSPVCSCSEMRGGEGQPWSSCLAQEGAPASEVPPTVGLSLRLSEPPAPGMGCVGEGASPLHMCQPWGALLTVAKSPG